MAQTLINKPPGARRPFWQMSLGQALAFALVEQLITLGLASILLDSGRSFAVALAAAAAFWPIAVVVALRRWKSPTKGDLLFMLLGFPLIAVIILDGVLIRARLMGG